MGGGPDRVDRFYATVRGIARFWVWFLFKAVELRHPERVPARGPVLLCINHPNNLIDSFLVGAVLSRKVHYLATAALFRNPLLAGFLRRCGAIPVYRRQDDPDKMDKNADAFAACFRALEQGRLIGIYPEGTTHSESRVQRIKTGAARIALEAGVPLVPAGISGTNRLARLGPLRVAYGVPIELGDLSGIPVSQAAQVATERLREAITELERSLS